MIRWWSCWLASGGSRARAVFSIDLDRGPLGYYFLPMTKWLFGWDAITLYDGPRSVQAAFKREELLMLARKAGLKSAVTRTHRAMWDGCRWRRAPEVVSTPRNSEPVVHVAAANVFHVVLSLFIGPTRCLRPVAPVLAWHNTGCSAPPPSLSVRYLCVRVSVFRRAIHHPNSAIPLPPPRTVMSMMVEIGSPAASDFFVKDVLPSPPDQGWTWTGQNPTFRILALSAGLETGSGFQHLGRRAEADGTGGAVLFHQQSATG